MYSLLDQAVEDRRDTQHSRALAPWLRYIHPPHRAGFIAPVEELLFDFCPMAPQVCPQLAYLHAIDSGGTLVSLHGLQSPEQIASFEHRFDEVWLSGFGMTLVSRRFCAAGLRHPRLPAASSQVCFSYLKLLFWHS
jgi:hypothetical protein